MQQLHSAGIFVYKHENVIIEALQTLDIGITKNKIIIWNVCLHPGQNFGTAAFHLCFHLLGCTCYIIVCAILVSPWRSTLLNFIFSRQDQNLHICCCAQRVFK